MVLMKEKSIAQNCLEIFTKYFNMARRSKLIYGRRYKLWREGEYIGEATFTNNPNLGDSFLNETEPGKFDVYWADSYQLIEE